MTAITPELRKKIISTLERSPHIQSPEAEAQLILFHFLRLQDPQLQNLNQITDQLISGLPTETQGLCLELAEARAKGRLLQHLLGYAYFYEHEYEVDESTLIPRPETEILIAEVIFILKKKFTNRSFRFAELGLGSGILSIELLKHFPFATGVASELNPEAIALAKRNATRILETGWESRLKIIHSSHPEEGFEIFLKTANPPFDLIISNPPYVSHFDAIEDQVLKHEPHSALFPPLKNQQPNPNLFYLNFITYAEQLLAADGFVAFEVPHERSSVIATQLHSKLPQIRIIQDLNRLPRVILAQR